MLLLNKKNIIVTGGTGGIGEKVVSALLQNGARVAVVARSKQKLQQLKNRFAHDQLFTFVANVSDYMEIKKIFGDIMAIFNKIDGLINMAAVNEPIEPFAETNVEEWIRTININLLGTVYCCRQILPYMIKQKAGKIINFSGGGAVNFFPFFSAYATSKAAVVRFTETIAEEIKTNNVYINAVAPGAINTLMLDNMIKAGPKVLGEDQFVKIVKQKEEGGDNPNLVCDLIVFLLSDNSFNLTGRLISAKWDNWKEWNEEEIARLQKTSEYTLRRIDNKYFQEIKK